MEQLYILKTRFILDKLLCICNYIALYELESLTAVYRVYIFFKLCCHHLKVFFRETALYDFFKAYASNSEYCIPMYRS